MTTQKTVLITGANGGLGKALVHAYLQNNWQVIAVDQTIIRNKTNLTSHVCDFNDTNAMQALLNQLKQYDHIDSLILNAAYYSLLPMTDISQQNLIQSWMVNVVVHFQLLQQLLKADHQLKHCFVIGTDQMFTPFANNISYCMTKAALMQMVKSFAVEYQAPKILGLCPITLEGTAMTMQAAESLATLNNQTSEDVLQMFAEEAPQGKHLNPEELAQWIYTLESDQSYQSGDIIYVDQQVIKD